MNILARYSSSFSSMAVLSSIFYRERLMRQMVGPMVLASRCLWSLPIVGEMLIERLTE